MINRNCLYRSNKPQRSHLSFAASNVDALSQWTARLPYMQLGDSAEMIVLAIYEISALRCSETLRFDLIQVLHPAIENILKVLEQEIFQQRIYQAERREQIIELLSHIRINLSYVYIDIVYRCEQYLQKHGKMFFQWQQRKNHKTARVLSCYYALQQLSALQLQQQMLYMSPLHHQWLAAHQLYKVAVKNNEHLINTNQIQGSKSSLNSVQDCYLHLLLLNIINTSHIRPNEMRVLYHCSQEWIHYLKLSHHHNNLSRYGINLHTDQAVQFLAKSNEYFKPDLYLSTQLLLEHINDTIHDKPQQLTEVERQYLSSTLKLHIQHVLGTQIQRQHERFYHPIQLDICFNLYSAHYHLSKNQVFGDTLAMPYQHIMQQYPKTHPVLAKLPRAYHNLPLEDKQIYSAQALDFSEKGYRLHWAQPRPSTLASGEMVLTRQQTQHRWKVGIIRWIKQSLQESYTFGIQIIAESVYPAILEISTEEIEHCYLPCLILLDQQYSYSKITLLLANMPVLQQATHYYLIAAELRLTIHKVFNLTITSSIVQLDITLSAASQQALVKNYLNPFDQQT
ncbi:hypothetical protein [Acinetobacter larvae]|uniref:hypothetical protein n=1 Tax=Acinetobacter larvae TaxID=1789224 RepID=UPI0009D6F454|nr:hypothetical protein [Acinetobacter larvae]